MHISRMMIGLALVAIFVLAVAVAFLLGRASSSPPARLSLAAAPITATTIKPTAIARAHPIPSPVAEDEPAAPPPLTLANITKGDWDELGMGCVCSLSVAGKEKFIAGGSDVAILRPNGVKRSCSVDNDKLQEMFDGQTKLACGSAQVRITPFGQVTPGEDGHSSRAKIGVTQGGLSSTNVGDWTCQC